MSLEEIGIALLSWCVRAVLTGMLLSVGVYAGVLLYLRRCRTQQQTEAPEDLLA